MQKPFSRLRFRCFSKSANQFRPAVYQGIEDINVRLVPPRELGKTPIPLERARAWNISSNCRHRLACFQPCQLIAIIEVAMFRRFWKIVWDRYPRTALPAWFFAVMTRKAMF